MEPTNDHIEFYMELEELNHRHIVGEVVKQLSDDVLEINVRQLRDKVHKLRRVRDQHVDQSGHSSLDNAYASAMWQFEAERHIMIRELCERGAYARAIDLMTNT